MTFGLINSLSQLQLAQMAGCKTDFPYTLINDHPKRKDLVVASSMHTPSSAVHTATIEVRPCLKWLLTGVQQQWNILKLTSKKEVAIAYER